MLFKKTGMIAALLVSTSLIAFPAVALADLQITNDSDQDSTSIINNGFCSSFLGESGITRAHSSNNVSQTTLDTACAFDKDNCQADVYMSADCTGARVATVVVSTTAGIKSVSNVAGSGFAVAGAGSVLTINNS